MGLRAPLAAGGFTIHLNPTKGMLGRRLNTARRTDGLPRAIGLARGGQLPTIVDATAGLGRDAMVLARLGCRVIAIERVPAFAFLLFLASEAREFDGRLQVLLTDARSWLHQLDEAAGPNVVYLDPMFAEQGRAQVKKEMQACRALAAEATDADELFRLAQQRARDRVVVKRHPHHPPLDPGVSHTVTSGRVRFDVYLA